MFVGGLPMAAIQEGPVVPNAYNYDPMAEIMKLGTDSLVFVTCKKHISILQEIRFQNITPPKDKKIYKLEPKHHDDDASGNGNSAEKEKKPEHPRPPVISPLSINTRRVSDGGMICDIIIRLFETSVLQRLHDPVLAPILHLAPGLCHDSMTFHRLLRTLLNLP
ncbi:unnamed protein product [Cylicostephanus goldi]|uniref:Uncharacterized protein n=1 Tax=Cylicostephanus goldi TaxID=71465 RepID=A0A3P6SMK8_CYLGO|nr:unnamed protein product [Cylicostephanus goldi]